MKITLFNHTVEAHYNVQNIDNTVVEQITQHTTETWQPNRQGAERKSNTRQGKIAEEIVEQFLKQQYSEEISLLSYDDIRNDNYKKHAPFDFLIWKKGAVNIEPIKLSIRQDISNAQNQFVQLSEYTRQLCRSHDVKITEVKSTAIRQSLKLKAGFNGNYDDENQVNRLVFQIKSEDDVFCYPYYKRSEASQDYSIFDYCEYVKKQEPALRQYTGEALRRKVIDIESEKQCCDLFIRVYIDTVASRGFVIGWMQKEQLLDYAVQFKRMIQPNKSERALYFTKKLTGVKGLDELPEVFDSGSTAVADAVYASPYTYTNFYHKSINCRFISNLAREEIIEFENENAAISAGRYTSRCRACYSEE